MRYLVTTLIEIPGPMPDMQDKAAVDVMLAKALSLDAIRGAWLVPILDEFEISANVTGSELMQ